MKSALQELRDQAIVPLLLTLLTFAAFGRVWSCDFINFDDRQYVLSNMHVRQGLTLPGWHWAWTTNFTGNWHPLTWLSLMLDTTLWGPGPVGFHMTNLALHALNATLLFLVLGKLTGSHWRSALVAALFAAHPLRVESVAWVSERKDVLSTAMGLASILAYVSYARRPRPVFYCLALILFTLSLLAKPMLVTMPFLLLLLDFWPLDRLGLLNKPPNPAGAEPHCPRVSMPRALAEKLPFLVLSSACAIATVVEHTEGINTLADYPLGPRLANVVVGYCRYIGKLLWPRPLEVFYPLQAWSLAQVLASAALLAVITAIVLRKWRTQPQLLVGWFWFVGTLAPVIGVIQAGGQSIADRYTYFPTVGLLIMLVWSIPRNRASTRPAIIILSSAAIVVLAVLASLTWVQVGYWRDSATLFGHSLAVDRNNWLAHWSLAGQYLHQRNTRPALRELALAKAALPPWETSPGELEVNGFLAEALFLDGQIDQAQRVCLTILQRSPQFAQALLVLGKIERQRGEFRQAMASLQTPTTDAVLAADAYNEMGLVYEQMGEGNRALAAYHEALAADPNDSVPHFNLGLILARQGNLAAAAEECRQAVLLDPKDPDSHEVLGAVLMCEGLSGPAIEQFRQALALRPESYVSLMNLGNMMMGMHRPVEAESYFEAAVRAAPDSPETRLKLVEALEDAGDWSHAAAQLKLAGTGEMKDAALQQWAGRLQKRLAERR